jgi:hypothetical protein
MNKYDGGPVTSYPLVCPIPIQEGDSVVVVIEHRKGAYLSVSRVGTVIWEHILSPLEWRASGPWTVDAEGVFVERLRAALAPKEPDK